MVSIHYNYNAAHLQRNIRFHSKAHADVAEKLSSGYRINKGADGPADLLISEQLRSQIDGLERAIQNTNESNNLMAIMEGAMGQVAGILQKMKTLAIHAANTGVNSPDQVAADQAQMDSALQALDRIFKTTNVGGRKLLDNLQIEGRIPLSEEALTPANIVATSDMFPRKALEDALLDGTNLFGEKVQNTLVGDDGILTEDRALVLTGMGENGDQEVQLSFKKGDSLDDVMTRLASYQEEVAANGIAAGADERIDPAEIIYSEDGSTTYMSAQTLSRLANLEEDEAKTFLGNYLGTFNSLTIGKISNIDFEKMSDEDLRLYQLGQQLGGMSLGTIGSLSLPGSAGMDGTAASGGFSLADLWSGGKASLANDPEKAMQIIDQAIKDAVAQRASIGATMAMSAHSVDSMAVTHENLKRMESGIRDTDMAESMTEYTCTQLLTNVGMQLLGQVQKQSERILDLLV
ncbi:MAG: flagellin [Planctomycetaceae bacterium]|nr:flagellin [Planctomycetaceae bacterium]